jgi:hypothetical protein
VESHENGTLFLAAWTCTSHWRAALMSLNFVVVTNVESISYVGELWRETLEGTYKNI